MAKFKFKAVRQNGEKYDGELDVENKFAVYGIVRKEGGTVVHIEEEKTSRLKSFQLPAFFSLSRVKMTDKVQFAKNLGTMIDAGLPIVRALAVMERQTRNKSFKKILVGLGANISKGETLSAAMTRYPDVFTQLFLSVVKAGEESGSLTKSLKSVGDQLEKAYLLTKKVRSAMIYPAIIFGIMIVISFLMLIYVVPTLSAVFGDLHVQLPLMTRIVIGLSNFLKNNILLSLVVAAVIGIGGNYFRKTGFGKRMIDTFVLRMPIFSGIVKEINSARTARTMASLLSSGVDILVAIKISGEVVQNSFYKEVLKKAEAAVEKGQPISGVFMAEERLYPAFMGEMANIGEETGKLGEMFENVAVFYENEVDQKTKDLSTVIEPFLMIFIGIGVGIFAISMLSPIYSLVDAIN